MVLVRRYSLNWNEYIRTRKYILVKEKNFERALEVLEAEGYSIV